MEFAGLPLWNRSLSTEIRIPSDGAWHTSSGQFGTSIGQHGSLLVIDPTVANYQQLVSDIAPGTDVMVLDPARDAIGQITQALLQRSGLSSLHIVSHGKAGALQLGANWLDANALDRDGLELKSWSQAFAPGADILLYGCDVAEGEQGQAFIQKFSQLTGADVAASTNLTGNAALGGDWTLEAHTGNIEAAIAFKPNQLNLYQGVLAADLISVANPTLFSNNGSVGLDTIDRNAMSGDGRFIVFTSSASTLTSNDNNSASDVFLYDRQAKTVTLISQNFNGTGSAAGTSYNPVISYDGNSVAFISNANDLVSATASNSSNADNIFVWERTTGKITLVSKDQNNKIGALNSSIPSISDDGAYIAFQSQAALAATDTNSTPRPDVYVWSRATDSLTHVSRNRTQTRSIPSGATAPMISGDGKYVTFASLYNNLSSLDESGKPQADNNGFQDVFLWERTTDTMLNLTVKGNGTSSSPFINQDGSRVAFVSEASSLAATDSNGVADIFVWTRSTTSSSLAGSIQLVSINKDGTDSGNAAGGLSASGSQNPILSRDGSRIAFTSSSSDLVSDDTNNSIDVFVRDFSQAQPRTILVNRSSAGVVGNAGSDNPTLSADGNRIVFTSAATNLVTNDNNNQQDVFVRDLSAGTTSLISRTSSGSVGNNISGSTSDSFGNSVSTPIISSDGSIVAFVSQASNLDSSDTNGLADGFVIPVASGTATLFTRRSSDPNLISRTGSGDSTISQGMTVSADGRFVVFTSAASELVAGDANGATDIFLRDRQTGTTTLISRNQAGTATANGASNNPRISADGRYIVFTSNASDIVTGDTNGATDVFWYDTQQQQMRLVSRNITKSASANGASLNPVISSDGRYVAFTSTASNLVNGDTNSQQDVFIWDSQTDTVTIVSQGAAASDGASEQPVISSDGRYVAFVSAATNLVSGDTNGKKDVFVWDRTTNSITLVSRATGASGAIGDSDSYQISMSQNGRVIAFTSTATNLGSTPETNGDEDVYVRDLDANTTVLVSATPSNGFSGNSGFGTFGAFNPVISGDGKFVAFVSNFNDLVTTDTNGTYDVFLRNLATNQTQLISINQAGTDSGNASQGSDGGTIGGFGTGSLNPAISNDGRYVAFSSFSSNLASGDTNNALDIFVRDTKSNVTTLVSRNSSDTASSNGASFYPVMSSNGAYIAFASVATDLTSQDLNSKTDVFGVNFAPSIGISVVSGKATTAEVSSNPSPAQYRIRRLNQTSGVLTVKLSIDIKSTASTSDYAISADPSLNLKQTGSDITLDLADGVTEAILNITPIDDIAAEPTENVILNVVPTADYAIADSSGTATITITDTDTVVINTNDQGEGSLRQAILNANANPGQDTIRFQIPGTGVQTISLASALPTLSDSVIIDGTSQSGFSNTPVIVLDGTNAGVNSNGLILSADNSTIKGLRIQNFSQNGILISSSNNTITNDVITSNNSVGIAVSNIGINNRITTNSISGNGGIGIDLGQDGVTTNDTGDLDTGANNLQNTVVITGAEPSGTDALVRGTFNGAANSTFQVEFFSSTTADPSGYGEGQTFLSTINITTDNTGKATFNFTAPNLAPGTYVTATVTDANGNTSEFSNAQLVARPKVSISAVNPIQKENAGGSTTNYYFIVSLDQSSAQTITARVNTTDQTATSPSDYTAFDQTLTFAPGETSKTITVQSIDDTIPEPDETFMVSVSPLTNADAGTTTSVQATIVDNDVPPTVSITNITADPREGNSGYKDYLFEVRLSGQAGSPVSVNYTTKDGTALASDNDYVPDSNTLTFNLGEVSKTITIRGQGDTKYEQDETFTVALSNVTGGAQLGTNTTATGTIVNDDAPPSVNITGATAIDEGQTGTTNYVFTVSLSQASSLPTTVEYSTKDLEATVADGDYVANSNTLTFAPGVTTQFITVVVNGDNKFEPDERFEIDLKNPVGATLGTQMSAIGTIRNDDPAPTLSITPTVSSLTEGDSGTKPYNFVVSLSNPNYQTVSVNYTTQDGTAKAGEDYALNTGTLTFAPGEVSKTIAVNINGDTKREVDETFSVNLSNPTNATITNTTATGTILNDDPVPTVSIQNVSANEGNSGVTPFQFVVSLSNTSDQIITVPYTTQDGTATVANQDYQAASGTLTFNPGDLKQTITVNVNGDTIQEANETFTVNLGTATNATVPTNANTATGTILNDDGLPSLSIASAVIDEGGVLSFVVNLSNASANPITVNFATSDGTAKISDQDYTSRSGTLTFAPNQISQTITVQTTADTKFEPDETINLTLSNATNATIATGSAIGTIRNDDPAPTLSITPTVSGLTEGNSGTQPYNFVVSLSNPSYQTISVNYTTQDGTAKAGEDYALNTGTLTFNPGEVSKTIVVNINGDTKREADETFSVNLSNATNTTITTATATGTILNDDPVPTVSIQNVSANEGNSGVTPFQFVVSLSNTSDQIITVPYTTQDGTATVANQDYQPATGTLTFNPGSLTQTITVNVNGDTTREPDETFTVNLGATTNAAVPTNANTATGTILNDDPLPQLSIVATTPKQPEGNSGTTPFIFVISLSQASALPTTVNYATTDGTATVANKDYVAASGTLTFAAGETQKTITVNALGDTQYEQDETFRVNLSNPSNATIATTSATATIQNDDTAPMTNNGLYDILWRNQQTGENTLWLPSTNVFNQSSSLPQVNDLQWRVVGRGDIDGNGSTDLLWYNSRTGENGFWQMQQNQMVKGTLLPTVSDLGWEIKGFADFNRDRKPDILWRNNRTGENAIWLMNGTSLTTPVFIPSVPDTSWTISGTGDFNNDGNSDILWRNQRTGEMALWQMNGAQIGTARYLPQVSDLAWKVEATGDFDRDGFLDILWRNQRTGDVGVWLMQNGVFQKGLSLATAGDLNWKIQDVGDFNGDGSLDLLWRNNSTQDVALWYLDGARYGTSTMIGKLPSGSWSIESIGDFNSDLKLSLILRNNQTGEVNLWSTNRSVFNQTATLDPLGSNWKVQGTGDFDNDGQADILWRNLQTGEISIWFTQNGQLRNQVTLPNTVTDSNWSIQGIGDFNRDGSRDILWRNTATGDLGVWFLNQGQYVNATIFAPKVDLNWKVEKVGDFNNDGNTDILWRNQRTGEVGIWLMNQTSIAQASTIATVGDLNWKIEGIGDFNRDGSLDIIWRNYQTGETGIWLMNGTRFTRATQLPSVSLDWMIAGIGDFNNDGQLDLLWRNTTIGSNAVWYLNGGNYGLGVYIDPITNLNWKVEGIDNF